MSWNCFFFFCFSVLLEKLNVQSVSDWLLILHDNLILLLHISSICSCSSDLFSSGPRIGLIFGSRQSFQLRLHYKEGVWGRSQGSCSCSCQRHKLWVIYIILLNSFLFPRQTLPCLELHQQILCETIFQLVFLHMAKQAVEKHTLWLVLLSTPCQIYMTT